MSISIHFRALAKLNFQRNLPVSFRSFADSALPDIIVSKNCAKRINELRLNAPDARLRLSVEGGGCSGFQYQFTTESENQTSEADDILFTRDGATVVVDGVSLDFVRGSTIDFVEEMIRSSFVVANNPLSESACGCGSSFAVKNFAANPALD
jgi:iron-sulfur cluster assembly accessory protein